ncbi:MAG TPA: sensor histidine kinase [Actinomycetota bacterium]
MTSRTAARLAWGIAILSYAMVAASLVLLWLDRATIGSVGAGPVGNLVPAVTLGVLGALIASRRPANPIGWLMLAIAATVGTSALAALIAIRALLAGVSPLGWVRWAAWVQNWIGIPGLAALILIFLLFPDGKLLSRRWRWAARLAVVGSVGFTAGAALETPVELSPHLPKVANPIGVRALAGFANSPTFLVVILLLILAVVGLLVRLRRSSGEERQQLKWFAYAAGVSVGLLILAIPATSLSPALSNAMFAGAFNFGFAFMVPAAAALAILRYGLYEVDVVINKTIVYFSLAAVITAIYVGIVVGIGAIIGSKGNVGLSVLATAIVAVAFQPIRDRSRRFANRLVYGKRATPYEVLSEFADRMAATYSVEDVLPRTARILAEATGAVRADVWLRVGAELHAAGSWPSTPQSERISLADAESPDVPGATRVAVVRHQGESLGALSIEKPPGDPMTPAEDKLLADVASQAGLVLRNVRLIEDLRASRQRIVAAQDAAARRLERNIHDGAQQQLVALAVKANLAQSLARKDPARAEDMLSQLKAEAQGALENLRDLARGIYPPLLADQGLVAALTAQARKSPVPVKVEADGVGRFAQDAEAAVYFCTLEALQNVAKYARATEATVHLHREDGHLAFEVIDDGIGFDPGAKGYGTGMQGMADRLAALGGQLTVTSSPGAGTTVVGRIPVAVPEPSPAEPHPLVSTG